MFELRPYQQECIEKILVSYADNPQGSELAVLPCGAGKTIIFSQVIHELNKQHGLNALILAHRDELLEQAAEKYRMVKPDAVIGKVGAGMHQYGGEVTCASVATASRPSHLKKLQSMGFGLVITDEAHHAQANSYQRIYDALPNAFHLHVTATPDRLDGKPLLDGKEPIYSKSIIDMIQDGYLCDIKAIAVRTDTDLDDVHTKMGDYKADELEMAIDTPERNQRVVEAYQEHCSERRVICFCVTVEHARNVSQAFCEAGITSASITGETPHDERRRLYAAIRAGEVKVLTSVQVLTEGFDETSIDCVIMARPTQSRALFVQCLGRGLRLSSGKENCVLLDITDNCQKHRLVPQSLEKVMGKRLKQGETIKQAMEREEEREKQKRELAARRAEDITVNLLKTFQWQYQEDGGSLLHVVAGNATHRLMIVPSEQNEDDGEVRYDLCAQLSSSHKVQYWQRNVTEQQAVSYAEREAHKLMSNPKSLAFVDRLAPWRGYPVDPTSKQAQALKKHGIQIHRG